MNNHAAASRALAPVRFWCGSVADKPGFVWYLGIEIAGREHHALRTHRNEPGHHGWQTGRSRYARSGRTGVAQTRRRYVARGDPCGSDHPRLTLEDIHAAQAFAAIVSAET